MDRYGVVRRRLAATASPFPRPVAVPPSSADRTTRAGRSLRSALRRVIHRDVTPSGVRHVRTLPNCCLIDPAEQEAGDRFPPLRPTTFGLAMLTSGQASLRDHQLLARPRSRLGGTMRHGACSSCSSSRGYGLLYSCFRLTVHMPRLAAAGLTVPALPASSRLLASSGITGRTVDQRPRRRRTEPPVPVRAREINDVPGTREWPCFQ